MFDLISVPSTVICKVGAAHVQDLLYKYFLHLFTGKCVFESLADTQNIPFEKKKNDIFS